MNDQTRVAFVLLRIGFTVAPIIAGIDKFFNLLTEWHKYLAAFIPDLFGVSAETFMMGVGVIEIVAGILVAVKPKWGGWIVSVWLVGIIIDLVIAGGYLDIALRDLGLAIGAAALALLASASEESPTRREPSIEH